MFLKGYRPKNFISRSLFSKLTISFILFILVPGLTIGFLSFKSSERVLKGQLENANRNTLNQIDKNLNITLDQIISIISFYNFNTGLEFLLFQNPMNEIERITNVSAVERKIFDDMTAFDWLKIHVAVLGRNDMVYSMNSEPIFLTPNWLIEQEWYDQILRKPSQIIWLEPGKGIHKAPDGGQIFTAVKALQGALPFAPYGHLILGIEESSIYNMYKDSLNGQNTVIIINSKGNIISHSDRIKVGSQIESDIYKKISSASTDSFILEIEKVSYLCLFKSVKKTDWSIIQLLPLDRPSRDIVRLNSEIAVISLICVLIASLVSIYFSRKISMPVLRLTRKIKSFRSNGDLAPLSTVNELDMLNFEYENLLGRLERNISELLKEKEQKRLYELQLLQLQIKPHFLYNTLNSIKCLVWTQRIHLIEPTIKALVNLLERTISRSEELITLEEEMKNTEDYLFLQNIRTDHSITTHFLLEDSIKKCLIPRLTLQPIVENSVFHGLEPKGCGKISVFCIPTAEEICIEIMDDGIGMDAQTVERLLEKKETFSTSEKHGIGMRNVDERLKLYFGVNYGLKIESKSSLGTSVILQIPKVYDIKEDLHA